MDKKIGSRLACCAIMMILTSFAAVAQPDQTSAQPAFVFTKALMAGHCHHYGREAIVTDQLAFLLYTGQWRRPEASATLFTDDKGKAITWQSIAADSQNRFRSREFANGYLYLTYNASKAEPALLTVSGDNMVYFNGIPHGGDIYGFHWLYLPVLLRKGVNELLIRCGAFSGGQGIEASLIFPQKPVLISTQDSTLPMIVLNHPGDSLLGAVVIINSTGKTITGLRMETEIEGKKSVTDLSSIPPMTSRKLGFRIDASAVSQPGAHTCTIRLLSGNRSIDEKNLSLDAVTKQDHYTETFVSDIDGSIQYYAVTPEKTAGSPQGTAGGMPQGAAGAAASSSPGPTNALFLSVHGAGVEAIGQARAYKSKDWGTLVAATNRRPRGFNWEDWGRLDALEVLALAERKFHPDPRHIYLTGHSMGGHGTWILGATYPDKWAGIGACSGYPSLADYGSHDGVIPGPGLSPMEDLLLRASHPSDAISLAHNYKAMGVYILHGDADEVVPVKYARQMRDLLGGFHADFSYYERPGAGHWYGDESVDWPPLFEFFRWHSLPVDSTLNNIDFTTADPGISCGFHWAQIFQQQHPLQFSHILLQRDRHSHAVTGTTSNIGLLALACDGLFAGDTMQIQLDGLPPVRYGVKTDRDTVFLQRRDAIWTIAEKPGYREKNPLRYGMFKDAFNHRMVFTYGTKGSRDENEASYDKARYDAETWYYRGNGAVDIVADKDFDPAAYPDRGVVVFGNAATNGVWDKLLKDCPIRVERGSIKAGRELWTGDNLGAYFIWPRPDSRMASVAVIAGSGPAGMQATEANQYFAGGSGFPDFMIFSTDMLRDGAKGIKAAGFFNNQWQLDFAGGDIIITR